MPGLCVEGGPPLTCAAARAAARAQSHVLLVPQPLEQLPQALSAPLLLRGLLFARELGRGPEGAGFRLGYNSLGAFATINHLHFQVRLHAD